MPVVIRAVEPRDLLQLTAIYNHYIVDTPTTFDLAPFSPAQRQAWLDGFSSEGRYRCFVADRDGTAVGWACSARFRSKAAYEPTVETSIYLAPEETGRGLGKRLYRTLFETLMHEDIHRAYAGVTLPNEPSVALHLSLGFAHLGTMEEVGRKFGRFWDVGWFELAVFPGMPLGKPHL